MVPKPNPQDVDFVIYHRSCQDGLGAAWAAWTILGDKAEYWFAQYGDDPPDVTGKHVAIVDFSYKRPTLLRMMEQAASMVILDHHKTAEAELADIDNAIFDMDKSGAMLSWEWFHPEEPPPRAIRLIQDRDLWHWRLKGTKEFYAGMRIRSWKFKDFDISVKDYLEVIREGKLIQSYIDQEVKRAAKHAVLVELEGHKMWMANHGIWVSEIGDELCNRKDETEAALIWFYLGKDQRISCSLRSADDGMDVSTIAKKMGGGGHYHAAGFRWDGTIEELVTFLEDPKG